MKLLIWFVSKRMVASHPARGAWIEMFVVPPLSAETVVAPRKGCVD